MSPVIGRRTRVLAGGALAALVALVAAPAHADPGSTSTPSTTTAATSPTTTDPALATAGPTPQLGPTAGPTAGPTDAPTSSPTSPTAPTSPPDSPTTAPTSGPTGAPATAAGRATSYLLGQLTDGTHVVGPYGPDLGQTSDVALALAASPGQRAALGRVTGYLRAQAGGYVHGDPTQGEKAGAHYAGPTGKLALVASVTGDDPRSFGGIDLLGELQALMVTSGPDAGRFRDDSAFGDYSNPLGQGFDVLALERAGMKAPRAAVDALVSSQCADGGFPDAFGAKTCTSSADATGLVLQALVAADADCSAARALAWLQQEQASDGSWPSNAANPTSAPVANVNSTAYAALGLTAATASTSKAVGYLTSVQNRDGGLPAAPSASTASNVFATAQAVPALAGFSLLGLGATPLDERSPRCAGPSATPTATPTPSGTPGGPASPTATAVPVPGPPTATPAPSGPSAPTSATGSVSPPAEPSVTELGTAVGAAGDAAPLPAAAAQSGPSQLAHTGIDVLVPVMAGVVLVFAGLTLLFLGRRRGGRHA